MSLKPGDVAVARAGSPEDPLGIQDVRARLGISRSGAYALVKRGALPALRISPTGRGPGAVRVLRRDLDAYVAQLARQAQPAAPPPVDADRILARVRGRR